LKKNGDEQFLRLTKRFGTVKLRAVFSRTEVCERIVLGTEEIPEYVQPEKVIPAHVKEIVEWRCPSLLEE
jgi:hypothetical protein